MPPLLRLLDPRGSLASSIGWLVIALSIGFAVIADVWVGDLVRANLLDLRGRQLDKSAIRIAAELNLNLALRLQSVRVLAAMLATEMGGDRTARLPAILDNVRRASPEFEWITVANSSGQVLASTRGAAAGMSVADQSWFSRGLKGLRVGDVRLVPSANGPSPAADRVARESFIQCMASIVDAEERTVGVIGTQLSGAWLLDLAGHLGDELPGAGGSYALLLDQAGTILIGPPGMRGKRWDSTVLQPDGTSRPEIPGSAPRSVEPASGIEMLSDGTRYLVSHTTPAPSDALQALGWRVLVLQRLEEASEPGKSLVRQLATVLLVLGVLAALLGVLLVRRFTRGLDAIARSADAVRTGAAQEIAVPEGRDEAARLGHALGELLASLQRERAALQSLNAELDLRVAARTREIERLGEQESYAAIVRERLKIARDLHDTLAHSMMAMLTQIRLLKRLAAADPGALADEFARAEEAALQGLREARAAIAQMRFNPVRDEGLAAALSRFIKPFAERTGIQVDFTSDGPAGALVDERAETLFRIAEEAMRNVERHARASHVAVSLHETGVGRGLLLTIADNGIGFDADAAYPGHFGLAGLREQAQLIGAMLTIESVAGEGTTIRIELTPERES